MGHKNLIHDIIIKPLEVIADERGMVLHMLREDDAIFKHFGEIYFSVVYPGVIKGWKRHQRMTQHFAVPVGIIHLVFYDDRKESPTRGRIQEIITGRDNYALIKIPPGIWYGFKGVGRTDAVIANCTDIPHDPAESTQRPVDHHAIPYCWEKELT